MLCPMSSGIDGDQKRASDPKKLESQAVVRHPTEKQKNKLRSLQEQYVLPTLSPPQEQYVLPTVSHLASLQTFIYVFDVLFVLKHFPIFYYVL